MTVRDREVLATLHDEPELLAIADAVAATRRKRTRRWAVPAAAAVAIAAALALLLVSPWESGGLSLNDRALAAIGKGPILHVIVRWEERLPDPKTGRRHTSVYTGEMWANISTGFYTGVGHRNGRAFGRSYGRLCIKPPLPPGCGNPWPIGFVADLRRDLKSGFARRVGTGVVRGRRVIWIQSGPVPGGFGVVTRFALDSKTYKPIAIRRLGRGQSVLWGGDVLLMESLPAGSVRLRP